MKKFINIIIILIITFIPLYAQYSYMPGDAEVEMLLKSYSLAGKVFPGSAFPLSKEDLYFYALEISDKGVLNILDYDTESVVFEESIEIIYEQYFRTKDAWEDFARLYLKAPDFLNITLNAQKDDLGGVYIQTGVKKEYDRNNLFTANNFFASESGNPIMVENEFIREGYFYYKFDSLDIVFGRNRVHYGAANFSTLYPSKEIPFIDALSYKFNLGNLQMQSYIATLENREAYIDVDVSGVDPDIAEFGINAIIATMHRFEYSWNKIRAGVGAQSFLVRADNGFQLGDFFPVFSWHNTVVGDHNMSIIADISIAPYPGIEIYLMGGVDDISATDLVGINDSSGIPTIPAWVAGVVYFPSFTHLLSKLSLEAGSTHYLWGNFYLENTEFSDRNAFARAIYRYKTDSGYTAIPMTSPYGPGAAWYNCKIEGGDLLGFTPEIEILYLTKIEGVDLFTTPYLRDDEAIDARHKIRTFNTNLTLSYKFTDWNTLYTTAGYYNQDGSNWMEFTLGGSIKFSNLSKVSK